MRYFERGVIEWLSESVAGDQMSKSNANGSENRQD